MQVQRVQGVQSNNYNTNFGAKLNITGTQFDEKVMASLSEKAKKVGLDNDIVEFSFSNYKVTNTIHKVESSIKFYIEDYKAQYLSKNKGFHRAKGRIIGCNDKDFLQQREQTVNDYLDKLSLIQHFGN